MPGLAERIIANNQPIKPEDGMFGGLQVIASCFDRRTYKRKAAEMLLHVPKNRAACVRLGLNAGRGDAILLARAAEWRRGAQRIAAP